MGIEKYGEKEKGKMERTFTQEGAMQIHGNMASMSCMQLC